MWATMRGRSALPVLDAAAPDRRAPVVSRSPNLLSRNYAGALQFFGRSARLHRGPPQLGAKVRRA